MYTQPETGVFSGFSMTSLQSIIKVTKLVLNNHVQETVEAHYFTRFGNRSFVSGAKEQFRAVAWKDISKAEADESLRAPVSGIGIGFAETWTTLEGIEKLWCDRHGAFFELRVWVTEP